MPEPKKEGADPTPDSSGGENQPGTSGDGDPSNKPGAEDKVKELEEQLVKERKARKDFETAFFNNEKKLDELKGEIDTLKSSKPDYQEFDDESTRVSNLVKQELEKERKTQREANLKLAKDKFIGEHPEYNDIGLYTKFKEKSDNMFLGNSFDEIYANLGFIHNGLNPKNPNNSDSVKSEVEDSGIGDAATKPKGQEKKPSALTRPLTELERQAASLHPKGEQGYREALAKREK
jgi:hypothetical protein